MNSRITRILSGLLLFAAAPVLAQDMTVQSPQRFGAIAGLASDGHFHLVAVDLNGNLQTGQSTTPSPIVQNPDILALAGVRSDGKTFVKLQVDANGNLLTSGGGGAALPAGTGLVKSNNGTGSVAVPGTDYISPAVATPQTIQGPLNLQNGSSYTGLYNGFQDFACTGTDIPSGPGPNTVRFDFTCPQAGGSWIFAINGSFVGGSGPMQLVGANDTVTINGTVYPRLTLKPAAKQSSQTFLILPTAQNPYGGTFAVPTGATSIDVTLIGSTASAGGGAQTNASGATAPTATSLTLTTGATITAASSNPGGSYYSSGTPGGYTSNANDPSVGTAGISSPVIRTPGTNGQNGVDTTRTQGGINACNGYFGHGATGGQGVGTRSDGSTAFAGGSTGGSECVQFSINAWPSGGISYTVSGGGQAEGNGDPGYSGALFLRVNY